MTNKCNNRNRNIPIDILRELMKGPLTREDLMEITGIGDNAVWSWTQALVAGGVVWRVGNGTRYKPYRFHLCVKPFERRRARWRLRDLPRLHHRSHRGLARLPRRVPWLRRPRREPRPQLPPLPRRRPPGSPVPGRAAPTGRDPRAGPPGVPG